MEEERLDWIGKKFQHFIENGSNLFIMKNTEDVWVISCSSEKFTYEFIIQFKPEEYLKELSQIYSHAFNNKSEAECLRELLEETTEIH